MSLLVLTAGCSQAQISTRSRASRIAARTMRDILRSIALCPPLKAFLLVLALPSAVRGPVDFSQGFHSRISAACRARRSGDQPLPMLLLQ